MTEQHPKSTVPAWAWWLAGGAALLVLICVCITIAFGVFGLGINLFRAGNAAQTRSITVQPVMPAPTTAPAQPAAPAGSDGAAEPAADDASPTLAPIPTATAAEELTSELPPRDRYDLAQRYLGIGDVPPPDPVSYQLGDVIPFWVSNDDTNQTVEVDAELVYMADNVYMWVEEGMRYDEDAMAESAERFSQETYPTDRSYFGSEASPGIDGDPRLHILHSVQLGDGIAGYFYSPSEYPASVVPYSNEKEIFFINIGNTQPGDPHYDAVLAHEFQHMIHWNVDQNEESWLNEGLSELAAYLNGYGASSAVPIFLANADLQLTTWPETGSAGPHYGAGFMFALYFLDRFGQDGLRALVASELNGLSGVDATLEALDAGVTADDVFADWVIANLLNAPGVGDGHYGYADLAGTPRAAVDLSIDEVPGELSEVVHQYGTDYVEITRSGPLTVTFDGSDSVQLIPTNTANTDGDDATDDHQVWWSGRGDDSDMMLTREVDLSGVSAAELTYDAWYDIEELWDYAYLSVSADGGQTWQILPTPYTTEENPHGNSYGPGYTGRSADQDAANAEGWLHEAISLNAYAGQPILLRFEMITDDAVNQPGLAVDNLCIAAIDWCDDAESADPGWDPQGFVRHDNTLTQRFVVQAIVPDRSGNVQVLRMPLDAANRGSLSFTVDSGSPATLAISGLTRHTTEVASYTLTVGQE